MVQMLCHVKVSHFWNYPLFKAHVLARVLNKCFSVMPTDSLLLLTDPIPLIDSSSRKQMEKMTQVTVQNVCGDFNKGTIT